jgi:2-keto-4-pentenoate hydratase
MNIEATKAAELLSASRRYGLRLPGLPLNLQPGDIEQGYAIQLAAARMRSATPCGFKIGLTSEAAQRAAGTNAPIVGRLAFADILRAPACVPLHARHLRVVEAEIVFEMGKDLPVSRAPFSEEAVAKHVRGAFAGLEICDSRFLDSDDLSVAHVVADNSFADRIVIGDALDDWTRAKLADLEVILTRQGAPPTIGSSSRVLGNPLSALTWLANWLALRGEGLLQGQWIATGSCTGITRAAEKDRVVATFADEARVSVELLPEDASSEVRA